MAVMFLRIILMARLLPIAEFASFSAALIVSGLVSTAACFGLFLQLQRSLPMRLARGQRRIASAEIAQTVIAALAVAAVGLVIALFTGTPAGTTRWVVLIAVVHGLSQQIFMIATTESRSNAEPLRYSIQHLTRSVATAGLCLLAGWLTESATSALIAELLATFAAIAFVFAGSVRRLGVGAVRATLLGARSVRAIAWGPVFGLLAYSLIASVSLQLDRWLSSLTLATHAFAQYAFAWIVMTFGVSIQALFNASAFPMIARRRALTGLRSAFRLAAILSLASLVLCGVGILPGLWVADLVIDNYVPVFADAKALIPFLAIAAAFRISDYWSTFLIVAGRERATVVGNLVVLGIALLIWFVLPAEARVLPQNLAILTLGISGATFVVMGALSWTTGDTRSRGAIVEAAPTVPAP